MPLYRATMCKDDNGKDAMLVTCEHEDLEGVVYMGTDEMLTLTDHETLVRDQIVSALTAPSGPAKVTPEAPSEPNLSIWQHIRRDPAQVAIGFVLGSAVICGLLLLAGALLKL